MLKYVHYMFIMLLKLFLSLTLFCDYLFTLAN